jgi:hypothetical protein
VPPSLSNKKEVPIPSSYTLHGQTLESVRDAKPLGVTITNNLHWGNHVWSVAAKATTINAFTHRNLKGCTTNVQTHCYKSMVRPILEYASSVWDPHQQGLVSALEAVQRRSSRRILGDFSPQSSASSMVSKLGLEPLVQRRVADKACMMYKIMHKLVDMNVPPGRLQPAVRLTRGHHQKLMVPHARTDVYRYSFFPSSTRLWNSLTQETVAAPDLTVFKKAVKAWQQRQGREPIPMQS